MSKPDFENESREICMILLGLDARGTYEQNTIKKVLRQVWNEAIEAAAEYANDENSHTMAQRMISELQVNE